MSRHAYTLATFTAQLSDDVHAEHKPAGWSRTPPALPWADPRWLPPTPANNKARCPKRNAALSPQRAHGAAPPLLLTKPSRISPVPSLASRVATLQRVLERRQPQEAAARAARRSAVSSAPHQTPTPFPRHVHTSPGTTCTSRDPRWMSPPRALHQRLGSACPSLALTLRLSSPRWRPSPWPPQPSPRPARTPRRSTVRAALVRAAHALRSQLRALIVPRRAAPLAAAAASHARRKSNCPPSTVAASSPSTRPGRRRRGGGIGNSSSFIS